MGLSHMGDWFEKLIPDSVSSIAASDQNWSEKGGKTERSSFIGPGLDRALPADQKFDAVRLLSSISTTSTIEDLISALEKEMDRIIPFEIGSLKWGHNKISEDEWDLNMEEGEFLRTSHFIARGNILEGSEGFEIKDEHECDHLDWSSGSVDRVCRARTRHGEPILLKLRSGLIIPLSYQDREIGVLSLFSSKSEALSTMENDLIAMEIWKVLGSTVGRIYEMETMDRELERANELLDSSEDLLVIWKSYGSMWEIECNQKAEAFIRTWDMDPRFMDGPFFVPPGWERDRAKFAWKRALESSETYQMELPLVGPDGNNHSFLCTFSPFSRGDNMMGVKMTGVENSNLNEATMNIEKINRGYRLLLSIMTHDLKNPLSAISGYADLLKLDNGKNKERYLNKITSLTGRMGGTLNDLMLFSKLLEGRVEGSFSSVDFLELVNDSLEMLHPKTADHDIVVNHRGGSFSIHGHQFLQQVVLNLMDNAIKYTPPGSRIIVDLRADLEGVLFSVGDQGPGINKEERDSIFDKFTRGDDGGHITGSGLGLAISKGIVDLHNGRIWVEDNEPEGSIFKVFLPWNVDP